MGNLTVLSGADSTGHRSAADLVAFLLSAGDGKISFWHAQLKPIEKC